MKKARASLCKRNFMLVLWVNAAGEVVHRALGFMEADKLDCTFFQNNTTFSVDRFSKNLVTSILLLEKIPNKHG